jgi:hypothetical protein
MTKNINIFRKRNEFGLGIELPIAFGIVMVIFGSMTFALSQTLPYSEKEITTITEEVNANYNLKLSEKSVELLLDDNHVKKDWTGEAHEVIVNPSEALEIYAKNKEEVITLYDAKTDKPLLSVLAGNVDTEENNW